MQTIKNTLLILHSVLDKKLSLLSQVYTIVENQEMFLKSLKGDELQQFMDISQREKQNIIEQVIKLDEEFLKNVEGFNGLLNQHKDEFKEDIILMQKKIQAILDVDNKIKTLDDSNKSIMRFSNIANNNFNQIKKTITVNKNYILSQYSKNSKVNPKKHKN